MTYYLRDGQILPQEIHLADGAWGLISDVTRGEFSEGAAAVRMENPPGSTPATCSLDNLLSVSLLDSAIAWYDDLIGGKTNGVYRTWEQKKDDQRVLVLYSDLQYSQPKPTIMHPVTRKLELIDRSERWTNLDIETGAWLEEWERFYLANGEVLDGGKLSAIENTVFDQLPADLQQAFDDTLARLNAYLETIQK